MTLHISIAEPGFFQVRQAKGAVQTPVLVYRPCPIDPHYGYPQQRWPQLQCMVDGKEISSGRFEQMWPYLRPISEKEYLFLVRLHEDAREFEPHSPFANTREAVDLDSMPAIYRKEES